VPLFGNASVAAGAVKEPGRLLLDDWRVQADPKASIVCNLLPKVAVFSALSPAQGVLFKLGLR
jgi:hypothetical protein